MDAPSNRMNAELQKLKDDAHQAWRKMEDTRKPLQEEWERLSDLYRAALKEAVNKGDLDALNELMKHVY